MSTSSARQAQLPIWRDANRLLLEIEQAVRRFPRYHKYALGTDLRRQAMAVCRCIVRAAAAQGDARERLLERLVLAVEDLKLSIQLAKELQAFASFAEFARAAELAVANSLVATHGMRRRWVANTSPFLGAAAAAVKCVGYCVEFLVGLGQCQQFE